MRRTRGLLAALALALVAPRDSRAESCKAFLAYEPNHSYALTLVSLNTAGLVSYASDFMEYHPKGEPGDPRGAGWWGTTGWLGTGGSARQLFSDRFTGVGIDHQPFAVPLADLLFVAITNEDSPQVTLTLRSWGNVKVSFAATCSSDGVLHGSVPNGQFLLQLRRGSCSGGCGG